MSKSSQQIRNLVFAALCTALGIVLPQAFHSIPNAGSIFLPMHLPVLLCGLICAWPYGLACGILTPILSHLIFGMPPAAYLPAMIVELAIYGLLASLMMQVFSKLKFQARVYVALVAAMIGGRIAYGIVNALIFRAGSYSMQLWMTAMFVTALPGIIMQIVILPILLIALEKANLVAVAQKA